MQQVGRYRLTRRLGQGGMAEVFEAVAEGEGGFRRRVALKRVLPELGTDLSIQRMFLDEARTTSHLHHSNIVAVLDYGTAEGSAFQVLEFVDGLDLDKLLRRAEEQKTPLPLGLALHIAFNVAQALDYAHNAKDEQGSALGIVHRDVSPSNVLVAWDGHIKLSDFGIALAANRLERTEGAGVKGKLEYMSPEQATRGHIDKRSDVFALGCMLHRLITGKSPLFELSALTRMASGEELTLAAEIEPSVLEIIRRATRNAQTLRYPSALALSRDIAGLLPSFQREEASSAMTGWLSGLKAEPSGKKRGALDALLDVELVLSAPDANTEARSFVMRTPVPVPIPVSDAALATVRAEGDAEKVEDHAPRRRFKNAALALFVLSMLGAAGVILSRFPQDRSAGSMPPPPLPAPAQSPATAPITALSAMPEPTPEPTLAAADLTLPAKPDEGRGRRERKTPVGTATRPKEDASGGTLAPTAAASAGTLVVGGDGALRAEIRVDGRSVGFAPKRIELGTGAHEIVLVRPDGTRVGPHTVRIESHHTQSAPAKWIVN